MKRLWPLLLAAFLAALAVRAVGSTRENLWIDEMHSLSVAEGGPSGVLSRMAERGESHPPLYYLVLSLWVSLAGSGDLAVRLPSILVGALAVPLAGLLARELSPGREGASLAVAVLLPSLVDYSQEARMYAQLTLLAALALLLWLTAPGRPWRGVALAAVTTALLYTHHAGLFVGAALGIVALAWPAPWRARAERAVPLLVGLAAFVPWLLVMRRQWSEIQGYFDWNLGGSIPVQVARAASFVMLSDVPHALPGGRWLQLVVLGLAAAGTVGLLTPGPRRATRAMTLVALALPVAMVAAFSMLTSPFFQRRYFVYLGLPAALLVAEGCAIVARALRGSGGAAALVTVLACALLGGADAGRLMVPRNIDMQGALALLDGHLSEGDTLYHYAPGALPQEGFLLARHYRPGWHHCFVGGARRVFSRETAGFVGPDPCVVDGLAAAVAGRDRVWLLMSGIGLISGEGGLSGVSARTTMEELEREVPPGYRVAWARAFNQARVVELARVVPRQSRSSE